MNKVLDFYVQGQTDCRNGDPEKHNNPDYRRGYEFEYWVQESLAWKQAQQEKTNDR